MSATPTGTANKLGRNIRGAAVVFECVKLWLSLSRSLWFSGVLMLWTVAYAPRHPTRASLSVAYAVPYIYVPPLLSNMCSRQDVCG